uniref:Cadherin N-terminal domain-containing protein n=1 Tax=Gouania willdenowi TaxID=441366 RepID=A0A8C5DPS5_GOUWI
MEQRRRSEARWWLAFMLLWDILWSGALAQIRYSISEEMREGASVGNVAKDLGLDKSSLMD